MLKIYQLKNNQITFNYMIEKKILRMQYLNKNKPL